MRLRLFTPLRAKIISSAQSLVPPSGRPSQESSLPILTSFNHLIGTGKQHWRHVKQECSRGFEIDDQLERRRLENRQVRRARTLEDLRGIHAVLTIRADEARSIAHQAAS